MTATVDFRVTFDVKPFARWLDHEIARQIPFATALALTRVAKIAQGVVRAELPRHFTIRTPFVAKGIRIRAATKSRLFAEVGSKDRFMRAQALGGTKTAKEGSHVAIPVGARTTPTSVTRKGKWPGRLLSRKRHFVAPLPSGAAGIWRRKGPKRRPRLILQYILSKQAKIQARWPLFATVERVVAAVWQREALKAFDQAFKSRRR
jgi:hypothetical protein